MSADGFPGGTPPEPEAPPAATVPQAASYALVGSYSTVQVLSPTLANDVVLCTIQTSPSGVIAALAVQEEIFDKGESGPALTNFANAIEQVMADPRVIAGVGDSLLDPSGLTAYAVTFTVEYRDPVKAPNGATATATVGVNQLDFSDATIGRTLRTGVMAEIDRVYDNLQAAAGG